MAIKISKYYLTRNNPRDLLKENCELKEQLKEVEEENFNLRENIYIEKMSFPSEGKNIKALIEMPTYEELQQKNQELKKQLEERDKWLIVCISELMEEYKKDTIWITNQQIESTKNKNISYEVYGGNDIKFYQNIKK